jgi:hypothetical protein
MRKISKDRIDNIYNRLIRKLILLGFVDDKNCGHKRSNIIDGGDDSPKVVWLERYNRMNLGARSTCKAVWQILKQRNITMIHDFDNMTFKSKCIDIDTIANLILSSRYSQVRELISSLIKSDYLVINGEGSMIFSKKPRSELFFHFAMCKVAKEITHGRIKTLYINSICSPDADGIINERTLENVKAALQYVDEFSVRDRLSFEFALHSLTSKVKYIPESLFYWSLHYGGGGVFIYHVLLIL